MKQLLAFILSILIAPPIYGGETKGHSGNPLAPVFSREQDPDGVVDSVGTGYVTTIATREPRLSVGLNGELLCVCNLAANISDDNHMYGFGLRVSKDGGLSWGDMQEIYTRVPTVDDQDKLNLGAISPALADGTVYVVWVEWDNWNNSVGNNQTPQIFECHSNGDDYTDWSSATEISDYVIKDDNSTPASLPAPLVGTNDNWNYAVPTSCVRKPNDDKLIFGMVYRYVIQGTNTSYFATFQYDQSEDTWSLLGGAYDEGHASHDADLDNLNENSMAYNGDGDIVAVFRCRAGANAGKIMLLKSTDNGVTWTGLVDNGASDTGLRQRTTNGGTFPGLCANAADADTLYLTSQADTGQRAVQTIYRSTDGGDTWDADDSLILFDGWSSYSNVVSLDSERIVAVYEATNNYADRAHEYEFLKQSRLNDSDIGGAPSPIHLLFNERAAALSPLAGPWFVDQGGADVRGFGNTAWTYTADGITNDSSTGAVLDPARASSSLGNAYDARGDSFTFEIIADFSNIKNASAGATQAIIANRNTGSTDEGWSFQVAKLTGLGAFVVSDGTNAPTASSVVDLSALSQPVHVALIRDVPNDVIEVWVNGTRRTQSGDTNTSDIISDNATVLGENPSGTNPAYDVTFYQTRFTRGVVDSADFISASDEKTPRDTFIHADPPLSYQGPESLSSCKMHLFHFRGNDIGNDQDDVFAPVAVVGGTGFCAVYDYESAAAFFPQSNSDFRTSSFERISGLGLVGRSHKVGSITQSFHTTAANTTWDFLHNTFTGTIIFHWVRFDADTGSSQVMLDNRNVSGSNNGVSIWRNTSSNTIRVVVDNGSNRVDSTPTDAFATGTAYLIAYVFPDQGEAFELKYGTWSGGVPPSSLTEGSGEATDSQSDSSVASTQPVGLWADSDGGFPCEVSYRGLSIYDEALTNAQILAIARSTVYVQPPSKPVSTRVGVGITKVDYKGAAEYAVAP